MDWSADYRIFERDRVDTNKLFKIILSEVSKEIPEDKPISVAMDDTKKRKKGRKIYGTSWDRDPMGPPFCNNFIWRQRFLQISAMIPEDFSKPSRARAIPVDFKACPVPKKPRKGSPALQWKNWYRLKEQSRMPEIGAQSLIQLRKTVDCCPRGNEKQIIVSIDGGFTNKTVFRKIPSRTVLIGRIRKDAKIYSLPNPNTEVSKRGRKSYYGDMLPTPEQIRKDELIPWTPVKAFASGKMHTFQIKTIDPIRWMGAGETNIKLVVIRPLSYRLTKRSRLLYRDPAYLICSDTELSIQKIIQNYVWRWEIELNFRDEKTLLGVGEAQTRTKKAANNAPEFMVAAYAMLLLACYRTYGVSADKALPRPKWQKENPDQRITTPQMIALMRSALWGKALGVKNKTDFLKRQKVIKKSVFLLNQLPSAVLYASR